VSLRALDEQQIRSLHATGRTVVDGVEVAWNDDDAHNLRHRIDALAADPTSAPYLVHVLLDGPVVAARIGAHAAPRDGGVEIGYFVAPRYRGAGLGTAVVTEFLAWLGEHGTRRVVATIEPDNVASLALVARVGFTPDGELVEEDGQRMLVFRRDLTGLTARSDG
jgi:RimJ/RimL family protein N-acetyltransferase